jgi:hypothetical protein
MREIKVWYGNRAELLPTFKEAVKNQMLVTPAIEKSFKTD